MRRISRHKLALQFVIQEYHPQVSRTHGEQMAEHGLGGSNSESTRKLSDYSVRHREGL